MPMTTNILRLAVALLVSALGMGCTTAYDAYGNPRQVVEPGTAILGAAAAGLLAYGLASDRGHRRHYAPVYPRRGYGYGYGPGFYGRPGPFAPGPCY
jgi:hypothetical protein